MADIITDVKKYLVARALTDTIPTALTATLGFGKNLFIGSEPATPVNCITLYPTGGFASSVSNRTRTPTLQVRVRHSNYSKGYAVTEAFIKDFHGKTNMLASAKGKCFSMQSGPYSLGKNEENTAHLFTTNFYFRNVEY